MATILSTQIYTPDDLLRLPDGKCFELVDGQLVEQYMGVHESMVAWLLSTLIGVYALPKNLGRGFASDLGYRCFPFAPNLVRKPDESFICQARLSDTMLDDGFCTIAPDLAFEIVSPSDPYREVETKIDEYFE